jgi:hypothetical protein
MLTSMVKLCASCTMQNHILDRHADSAYGTIRVGNHTTIKQGVKMETTNYILRSEGEAQTALLDLLSAFRTLPVTNDSHTLIKDFERYTSIQPASAPQAIEWAMRSITTYIVRTLSTYHTTIEYTSNARRQPKAPADDTECVTDKEYCYWEEWKWTQQ